MVIRIILGSYLQFGGTVSRCVGEPQLVYSFPFLGLNCTAQHCSRIVPDIIVVSLCTGCFCTWWVLNNNGIVQREDYWDSTAVLVPAVWHISHILTMFWHSEIKPATVPVVSLQCDIHHTCWPCSDTPLPVVPQYVIHSDSEYKIEVKRCKACFFLCYYG